VKRRFFIEWHKGPPRVGKVRAALEFAKPFFLDLVSNSAKIHYLSLVSGMHVGTIGEVMPAVVVVAWRTRTRRRDRSWLARFGVGANQKT